MRMDSQLHSIKRVALRYARQNKVKFIKAKPTTSEGHRIEVVNKEGLVVGHIEGFLSYVYSRSALGFYECSKELKALFDLWVGEVPSWDEEGVPIFEIDKTFLEADYRGMKIGIEMYKEIASQVRREVGAPMFFIPGYCGQGETSEMANRVWKSLTRSNLSDGDVILMVKQDLT